MTTILAAEIATTDIRVQTGVLANGGDAMSDRGRRRRYVTVVLLVTLIALPVVAATARVFAGEPVQGHPGIAGFRHSVHVDHDTYGDKDPVVVTFTVCRSHPWPTTTNSSFTAEFRVVDQQGDAVADTTHRIYPAVLSAVHWWPGQCRSVDYEWDQHSWNQPDLDLDHAERPQAGLPLRGDRVEAGSYRFEVWWLVSAGNEPDHDVPAPIESDPFELEP